MTHSAIESSPLPFAERLKQARSDAGLTIAALAAALGVDPRTVAGWQADRSKPSYERLVELARVLNVSPSYFLDGEVGTDEAAA